MLQLRVLVRITFWISFFFGGGGGEELCRWLRVIGKETYLAVLIVSSLIFLVEQLGYFLLQYMV